MTDTEIEREKERKKEKEREREETSSTFHSISGFALPSLIHNKQLLLYVSYFWNFRHRLVRCYWYHYFISLYYYYMFIVIVCLVLLLSLLLLLLYSMHIIVTYQIKSVHVNIIPWFIMTHHDSSGFITTHRNSSWLMQSIEQTKREKGWKGNETNRRKFRSQTSDNMDRWKAEQGRGREKRKIRRKKSRRERVRRKKMQMREKVGKSRNTVFFQWFGAPEGRKVGSLKRRVRSQLARWEMKNCTPLWREAHLQVKM